MNLSILPEANADLVKGFHFYERQNQGFGDYFLNSLFADIESLQLYGGIHEVAFGYHRSLAKTFPFAIYYRIEETTVKVYAVLDCRMAPADTTLRLNEHD